MVPFKSSSRFFRTIASRNFYSDVKKLCKPFMIERGFINGEWLSPINNKRFDVFNPADDTITGQVSDFDSRDTEIAIEAASNAFQSWSRTTPKERASLIRKLYELQLKNIDALATLISLEMGKPIKEARGEIVYGASFLEWFAEQAKRVNGEIFSSPFPNSLTLFTREPAGVVGIITPWNFPNAMITRKLGAALAAGCTVIIRPSEFSSFSGLALAKLAQEAGFPPGTVNVVTSSFFNARFISRSLCTSPDVSVVSFTGSTRVGKLLLEQGVSTVKRLSLELGGNAPFIVFDSANIDEAVQGCIASKFRNTGQTCVCSNVIYAHSSVYDKFVEKLQSEMKKQLKVGNPLDEDTTIGPLVNSNAVEKVRLHIDNAVSMGAKVITGGKVIKGNFFEPTILTHISSDMVLCQEETFGPVAPIYRFENEEDVIKKANSNRVGLAGYFFSSNHDQIWRVARALQVGMVGVNTGIISCCEAPFGGVKESGLGREGSHFGTEEFTNVKYICIGSIKQST